MGVDRTIVLDKKSESNKEYFDATRRKGKELIDSGRSFVLILCRGSDTRCVSAVEGKDGLLLMEGARQWSEKMYKHLLDEFLKLSKK